jgi:hypothetical protein
LANDPIHSIIHRFINSPLLVPDHIVRQQLAGIGVPSQIMVLEYLQKELLVQFVPPLVVVYFKISRIALTNSSIPKYTKVCKQIGRVTVNNAVVCLDQEPPLLIVFQTPLFSVAG